MLLKSCKCIIVDWVQPSNKLHASCSLKKNAHIHVYIIYIYIHITRQTIKLQQKPPITTNFYGQGRKLIALSVCSTDHKFTLFSTEQERKTLSFPQKPF